MNHTYFFDGNERTISWIIENDETKVEQTRIHAEPYYDKVSIEQSKYVALHVGIFWGIGRFIIKNGDTIKIILDLRPMFEHLAKNKKSDDPFIESRTDFIKRLINQRNLDVRYQMIDPGNNQATGLLSP